MTLSVGSDGLPKCETRGAGADSAAAQALSPAEATAALSGGVMSKSSLPMHLLAAAVIAAVVSFLVVTLTKQESQAGGDDSRVEALEKQVQDLEAQLKRAAATAGQTDAAAVQDMGKKLTASVTSVEEGLAAQTKSIGGLQDLQTQMSKAFAKLQDAYKALNGRIEGNYQTARDHTKRLKALEGK